MEIPLISQLVSLAFTIVACGLIGFEREYHGKDAGLRTNVLVGMGSWLFTMVSLYGYNIVADTGVNWDASRIAAQIVSGIGFIGAGVIFYNHANIKGLTTAAGIWVGAAIGMAAACNLLILTTIVTACYFILILLVAPAIFKLTHLYQSSTLEIEYENGKGSLRDILLKLDREGFETQLLSSRRVRDGDWSGVSVGIRVRGHISSDTFDFITDTDGVRSLDIVDDNEKDW